VSEHLRFLVFGAGAIGTYIGGSLALKGHRVTFIEQPQVVEELQRRGLRLNLTAALRGAASFTLPPIFTIHPSTFNCASSLGEALSLGPYEAAIFALKSYDTEVAIQSFLPFRGDLPPILCLQNGVENEARLAAALGKGGVIAGTVTSAIGRKAAGDIFLERLRGVGVAAGHPLSERLARTLNEAGLNTRLFPSAAEMKWSKLLTNLLANATSAILDMTPAQVFAHPGLYRLEIEGLHEALRVMAAQSLRIVDLPGTPVRLLALGARLPYFISKPLMQRSVGSGRGGKMPSFHIDLHSGRGKSEVDYLNGAVVRFGERLSVPTPVNKLLCETLLGLTGGEIAIETYRHRPERLIEELGVRKFGIRKPGN
jgi:2-dehydropantoate 2-reductase